MKGFLSEQLEVYEKSLEMAQLIYRNQKGKKKDSSLITHIRKSYREVLNLQGKSKEPPKVEEAKSEIVSPALRKPKSSTSPIPPGKAYLSKSIEESNHNIKLSKAGKSSVRYSSRVQPSVRTLNLNLTTDRPLPHVNMIDGKTTQPLNLPLFKDYSQLNESSEEAKKQVLENLERCEKTLQNFYKSLNGLELFCNANPGVPWNNDKKVLHKLYENPNYKLSIIRSYNENLLGIKNRSTLSRISFAQKKFTSSHSSFDSTPINHRASSPQTDAKLDSIQEIRRPKTPALDDPEIILERCHTRFTDIQFQESQKILDIFKKLKKTRPWCLRQKWEFIMKDSEKYKNKLDTLMKFQKIKREVNSRQSKRLEKNKSQAKIYYELLEVLKGKGHVTDIQITFVNFIRAVLEDGWTLNQEILTKVVNILNKQELEELNELIKIVEDKIQ